MKRRTLASLAALWIAAAAHAQQPDFSKVEIKTTPLAPGLAMLEGAGGNIVVSTGKDGPVIVDDQFAPLAPKIAAAVKALQDAPIRFVVNTHFHGDHTGGNEVFGTAGALIVAHDNVRVRLSTEQFSGLLNRTVPASPPAALPVVTFAKGVTLHWNEETITAEHAPSAHTDGDALIWFAKANAVHCGDTFVNGSYPIIDVGAGGSLAGLIASAESVLAAVGPGTKIVPGHGKLATRADLVKFRDMLGTLKARVEGAIAAGKTLEAFRAEKPLADLDPEWAGLITADQVLGMAWADLSRKR